MLQFTAITRQHVAPCNHWTLTIQNDNTAEQVVLTGITPAQFEVMRFDDQRWWVRLAMLWLKQKLLGGATPAQCVAVEIITLANANALLTET
jgi:hypothetical protein